MWFHLANLFIYMTFLACLTSFVATYDFPAERRAGAAAASTCAPPTGGLAPPTGGLTTPTWDDDVMPDSFTVNGTSGGAENWVESRLQDCHGGYAIAVSYLGHLLEVFQYSNNV